MLYTFAVSHRIESLPFIVAPIWVEYLIDVLVDCDVLDRRSLPIFLTICKCCRYFLSFWSEMRLVV